MENKVDFSIPPEVMAEGCPPGKDFPGNEQSKKTRNQIDEFYSSDA